MNPRGMHILLDVYGVDPDILDDLDLIRQYLLEAAEQADATVVDEVFYKFDPVGLTGILVLGESHLSIHTYPEENYASIDCYTCGNTNPVKAAEYLLKVLAPEDYELHEIIRAQKY